MEQDKCGSIDILSRDEELDVSPLRVATSMSCPRILKNLLSKELPFGEPADRIWQSPCCGSLQKGFVNGFYSPTLADLERDVYAQIVDWSPLRKGKFEVSSSRRLVM